MSVCYGGGIAHTLSFKCVEDKHMGADKALGRYVCDGCGNEIDPDCCGCGDSREGHNSMWSGHSFVPMGCDCMRERSQADTATEPK